jgi:hypothetical protein
MVSAVSSTATTRTSSGSRLPHSCSTAPLGSSISLYLKDSSSTLFSISLRSISWRPVASLMRASPCVLAKTACVFAPVVRYEGASSPCHPTPGKRRTGSLCELLRTPFTRRCVRKGKKKGRSCSEPRPEQIRTRSLLLAQQAWRRQREVHEPVPVGFYLLGHRLLV